MTLAADCLTGVKVLCCSHLVQWYNVVEHSIFPSQAVTAYVALVVLCLFDCILFVVLQIPALFPAQQRVNDEPCECLELLTRVWNI